MKPGVRDFLWMAARCCPPPGRCAHGAAFSERPGCATGVEGPPTGVGKSSRLSLTAAAEAEKRAVMATTDAESQSFADEVRAATFAAEKARGQLEGLLSRRSATCSGNSRRVSPSFGASTKTCSTWR